MKAKEKKRSRDGGEKNDRKLAVKQKKLKKVNLKVFSEKGNEKVEKKKKKKISVEVEEEEEERVKEKSSKLKRKTRGERLHGKSSFSVTNIDQGDELKTLHENENVEDSVLQKQLKKKKKNDAGNEIIEKKLKKKMKSVVDVNEEEENAPFREGPETLQGMEKWIAQYNAQRPGLSVLQEQLDNFIADYEEREERARKEREAAASSEGWTLVTRQKGKKKSRDAATGTSVGAVHPAVVATKEKKPELADDFYKFQKDSRRNVLLQLQLKFQEDKKKIAQMRAARKFRPYQ